MTTKTAPRARLARLSTVDLIAQYDLAISSNAGRYSEQGPRQKRINYIVDLLLDRANADDTVAQAWLDAS